jgi:hypothetical protein
MLASELASPTMQGCRRAALGRRNAFAARGRVLRSLRSIRTHVTTAGIRRSLLSFYETKEFVVPDGRLTYY